MVPAHRGHTAYGPTVYGLATDWTKERVTARAAPPKPKQDPANRMQTTKGDVPCMAPTHTHPPFLFKE